MLASGAKPGSRNILATANVLGEYTVCSLLFEHSSGSDNCLRLSDFPACNSRIAIAMKVKDNNVPNIHSVAFQIDGFATEAVAMLFFNTPSRAVTPHLHKALQAVWIDPGNDVF